MTAEAAPAALALGARAILSNPFYVNALLGALAVAVLCGLLSSFVVLKRMAFIGQGISHAAFGGVGVALLLEAAIGPGEHGPLRDVVIALFCVGSALGIGYLSRRGRLGEDSAIGICLVAAMALGFLLIEVRRKLSPGPVPSLHHLLFGNLLFVTPRQVWTAWALAAVALAGVTALFKELVFAAFDAESAEIFGLRTSLLRYGMLVLLGLAVFIAMRTMGVILASALLILPAATARPLSGRMGVLTAWRVAIGAGATVAGLLVAIWAGGFSPEPIIVLTLFVLFVASWVGGAMRSRRRRTTRQTRGDS